MAGMRITKFAGVAPRISPELLGDTAAQVANNCNISSGDLVPYTQPVVVGNTKRSGNVKTLYTLRDPDTNDRYWLSWLNDVDVAVVSSSEFSDRRYYYTGDGVPKVTDFRMATYGAGPYPYNYYDLGVPMPASSLVLSVSATAYTAKSTASYSRDASGIATLVTGTAHGLKSGTLITVSEFTSLTGTYSQTGTTITVTITGHGLSNGEYVILDFTSGTATDGTYQVTNKAANTFDVVSGASATTSGNVSLSLSAFNTIGTECTVVDNTTLTYYNPGPQMSTTAYTAGKVDLGGITQERTYVFTYYTPWEEESIPSVPSSGVLVKEGQVVTVTSIPTSKPTGNNSVRGVRLYRSLSSTSDADYFLLTTLWFPFSPYTASRASNVATITCLYPHALLPGSRFKLTGAGSFDVISGTVLNVVDSYTFEYSQVGANAGATNISSSVIYYDVAESTAATPVFWGFGGDYSFTDNFDARGLSTILPSMDYDPPPANLKGLTVIQNNILAGFVDNMVYFSEPGLPYTFPTKYIQPLEHDVVALATINGYLLVMTTGYPYQISGNDPAILSVHKLSYMYPCVSKRSVANMGYGIVYAGHDGLVVFSPGQAQLLTKLIYDNDTWNADLDPASITASFYEDNYFVSHSTGAFIIDRADKATGIGVDYSMVTTEHTFSAPHYDSVAGSLYFVQGLNGDIYEWGNSSQPASTMEWKSKVFITKDMMNFGAARVIADYSAISIDWDDLDSDWEDIDINWDGAEELILRLWADKQLVVEVGVEDKGIFRLPSGYKSDTFEVGITSNIRVRAVHLGGTPAGLKEV